MLSPEGFGERGQSLPLFLSVQFKGPAFLILDLKMPVMDGFEMIAELHKHEDWRKIPVVVVSAKELRAQNPAKRKFRPRRTPARSAANR